MVNGEAMNDTPPTEANSINKESVNPAESKAQIEFLDIKQALTDRQASPDPRPGWILPNVDEKAQASQPKVSNET